MDEFQADAAGLQQALEMLLAARSRPGRAHSTADVDLGDWPEAGVGPVDALHHLAGAALTDVSRLDHPGFLAHMDPPTPWVTWATAMWSAAMNQNLLHEDTGPAARQVERQVIGWLAPTFGMLGGHLVPGSTVANLTALWAARKVTGVRRVICSQAAHVSIAKAADLLGLDLVQLPVDDAQRMRLELLPDDLSQTAVVLTAGTASTGAIDPLKPVGAAWTHVDAAWAGPLRMSSHRRLLDGIESADSVSCSAHKWLFQPKESAMVLFADPSRAHAAMAFGAPYLAGANVGLLGSHGASAALALAASLLAWGRHGVRDLIDASMRMAGQLVVEIENAGAELWRPPVTGVVNWRMTGADCREILSRLDGAWVSVTDLDGDTWFRSVAANPMAQPRLVVQSVVSAAR